MITTDFQAAIVPDYVLSHYDKYISATELIILMHLQTVPLDTKESWEIIAGRMGYENIGPIRKAINRMEAEKFVVTDAYKVDCRPLYLACKQRWDGADTDLPSLKEKPAKAEPKSLTREQRLYKENKWETRIKGNYFGAVNRLKPICAYEEDDEKIVGFIEYAYSLENRNRLEGHLKEGIWQNKITLENYKIWEEKGYPKEYKGGKKKRIVL